MYDVQRVQQLKAIMDRHRPPKKSDAIDVRPTSGMVGQACEGFVPDAGTERLFRVAVEASLPDDLGPGSYEQSMPTPLRCATIHHHDRDMDLANHSVKPGPCHYPRQPSSTRLAHDLTPSPPSPIADPPLGGSILVHASWLPPPPAPPPRAKHPEAKFKTSINTPNFADSTSRDLWQIKFRAPSPVVHAPQTAFGPPGGEESSIAFRSRIERFDIPGPFTPPATAYTLPARFGDAPSALMHKPSSAEPRELPVLPDGAQYAAEVVRTPDTRHRSPQFLTKDDRFADPSFHSPGPAAYALARGITLNKQKGKIRTKPKNKVQEWDNIPQRDSPAVGHYEMRPLANARAGYISTIGHGQFAPKQPDRPLAFQTKHASLIRKSHNARYRAMATE